MSSPSKPKEEMEKKKKKKKLRGRIIPRQPHVKTQQRNYLLDRPVSTAYYYWPPEGRGERIVDENDYKRMVELLLHLDFSTLAKASGSTKRWISEVAIDGTWGREIVGICEPPPPEAETANGGDIAVTNLSGLTRKKRSADTEITLGDTLDVNVLGAGLVRKKRKGEDQPLSSAGGDTPSIPGDAHGSTGGPKVNVLGTGLVRKKPKPA
jgi:regulator of Ty1 transposition protein 109